MAEPNTTRGWVAANEFRWLAERLRGWGTEGNASLRWAAAGVFRWVAESSVRWRAERDRGCRQVAEGLRGWMTEGNANDRRAAESVFRWMAEGPGVAERSGATPGTPQRVVSQAVAERLARMGACTGEHRRR